MAWDMWQHQNEALHESEVNQQEILEDAINQNICQAYAQGKGQLPKGAMSLMKWPLSKLLRLPAPYKQQWLATLEAVRAQFPMLEGRTLLEGMTSYDHLFDMYTQASVGPAASRSAPQCKAPQCKLSYAQQC